MRSFVALILSILAPQALAEELWHGLVVAPEHRCAPYDSKDYLYPQSLEPQVADRMGGWLSPYTNSVFASPKDCDIEHIVARSEAHDSGMCSTTDAVKLAFARDIDNLTLASPKLNRYQKRGKDAAEWMPPRNRCWFARKVILVKRKWGMTVDQLERDALEGVLRNCEHTRGVSTHP